MTGTPTGPIGSDKNGPSAHDFTGIGLQFAFGIIVFLFIGQWLDKKLGTAPWLLIVSAFTGAGLSFYNMYVKLQAIQAREDAARKARKDK